MILKLGIRKILIQVGMEHQREELYKVYINHDLGMTLTYFTARTKKVAKLSNCHFKGKKLIGNG